MKVTIYSIIIVVGDCMKKASKKSKKIIEKQDMLKKDFEEKIDKEVKEDFI